MRKLRLKSVYYLLKEYEEYNFVNCSFDYDGYPNILLIKGNRDHIKEFELHELLSKNKLDYLLIIVSEKIEEYQLNGILENYDFAMKVDNNKYLFACSFFCDEEGRDFGNNCKIYDGDKTLLNEFC